MGTGRVPKFPQKTPSTKTHKTDEEFSLTNNTENSSTVKYDQENAYNCNGDRWGNHLRLHPNQYLCAHGDRYYFGVTESGSLVWVDLVENATNTCLQGQPGSSFSLLDNGTFVLEDKKTQNTTTLDTKPKFNNIHWTERCLRKFDCPYLHLHSDGVIVLNWIDDELGWIEKSVKHVYDGLDCLRN